MHLFTVAVKRAVFIGGITMEAFLPSSVAPRILAANFLCYPEMAVWPPSPVALGTD